MRASCTHKTMCAVHSAFAPGVLDDCCESLHSIPARSNDEMLTVLLEELLANLHNRCLLSRVGARNNLYHSQS